MLADGRHFKVSELSCHDEARTPYPEEFADRLPPLMTLLDAIRDAWHDAILIVSGYRTPEHNAALIAAQEARGTHQVASSSQHIEGRAADLRPVSGDASQLYRVIRAAHDAGKLPGLGGIGLYVQSNWVHCDCRPLPPDGHLAAWLGT
jgi:uncharacterized protein YcbK (DUF882 family)